MIVVARNRLKIFISKFTRRLYPSPFNPTISEYSISYRREHTPNIRYLVSDITVTIMHQFFLENHPELQYTISYNFYRNQIS